MNLEERQARYKAVEDARGRPLIVYVTSTRLVVAGPQMKSLAGIMAADVVREFIEQMDTIPDDEEVDILIHSTGGDLLAAWKLMSMLRERFKKVYVLVPFMAFSAATLFALGADEIVMHPHASLGPIDPQITLMLPDGKSRRFSYEDVGAFLRFLTTEVKITEQAHVSTVIEKLFSVVDPVNVGGAKRASELSSSVGERLLCMHMKGKKDKARAKQIAVNLNKSFFSHGDAVSRSRARELNLKIAPDNPALEKLIWCAFLGIESYMDLRNPFVLLQHYLANPLGAAALVPAAPLVIPANTPPQIAQQIWNAVMQNAVHGAADHGVEVDYSVVNGLLESTRLSLETRTDGKIFAFRSPNGDVAISLLEGKGGSWKRNDPACPAAPPPTPGPAPDAPVPDQGSVGDSTPPAPGGGNS